MVHDDRHASQVVRLQFDLFDELLLHQSNLQPSNFHQRALHQVYKIENISFISINLKFRF